LREKIISFRSQASKQKKFIFFTIMPKNIHHLTILSDSNKTNTNLVTNQTEQASSSSTSSPSALSNSSSTVSNAPLSNINTNTNNNNNTVITNNSQPNIIPKPNEKVSNNQGLFF
jgi:hypothetical protein